MYYWNNENQFKRTSIDVLEKVNHLLYRHMWNVNLLKKYKSPLNVRFSWEHVYYNNHHLITKYYDPGTSFCVLYIHFSNLHIDLKVFKGVGIPVLTIKTPGLRNIHIT